MSLPESSTNAVLACFFEGTANCLQPTTTQIGQFFDACDHYDITEMLAEPDPNLQAFKMGFDGCGYAYGPPGTIWAVGLGSQCQVVVARVQWLLQTRRHVTVVALGLSRGGVAALMLAKRLGGFDPERLSVQLCAFDPVPGNLVCASRYIDLLGLNAANCVLDCSGCRTLRRVLALYPHEPLPDLAFHAPIFPRYPSSDWCEIEEDAVLGCHQGALYPHKHVHPQLRTACKASYIRIRAFLRECGVRLSASPARDDDDALRRECLQEYVAELAVEAPTYRIAHSSDAECDGCGAVLRHRRGVFLNQHHRQLVAESSTCDLRQLAETETDASDNLAKSTGLHRRAKGNSEESEEDDSGGNGNGVARKKKRKVFLLEVRRHLPQRQQTGCWKAFLGLSLITFVLLLYYKLM